MNKILLICILVLIMSFSFGCSQQFNTNSSKIDKGEWIVVNDVMSKSRKPCTANLLPDGNVLLMGGIDESADTADIFDPRQMKIIKTIQLDDKRYSGFTTISLKNGDVFVLGGYTAAHGYYQTTKIFDAKTYTFRNVKSLDKPVSGLQELVLLDNGHILILDNEPFEPNFPKLKIYNPEKDEYYYTKNGPFIARNFRFIKLENNKVLIWAGTAPFGVISYIYNSETNEFNETEPKIDVGMFLTPLDNNSFLKLQPSDTYSVGSIYKIKENEEIPVNNHLNRTWRPGNRPFAVQLANGNLLIKGINVVDMKQEVNAIKKISTFLYDREKNMFFQIPNPPYPMSRPGIVTLPNGDILFAGGRPYETGNKIMIYKYKH